MWWRFYNYSSAVGERLDENTLYTGSISVITDPRQRANDIVASASLLRTVPDPALDGSGASRAAGAPRGGDRASRLVVRRRCGRGGEKDLDRHAALDALLDQVGLTEATRYDRQSARVDR